MKQRKANKKWIFTECETIKTLHMKKFECSNCKCHCKTTQIIKGKRDMLVQLPDRKNVFITRKASIWGRGDDKENGKKMWATKKELIDSKKKHCSICWEKQ